MKNVNNKKNHKSKIKKILATMMLASCLALPVTTLTACDSDDNKSNTGTEIGSGTEVKHDHIYGEWKTTKAATCVAEGIQTRHCVGCDHEETRTVSVDPNNHQSEFVAIESPNNKAATCSEEGSQVYQCPDCHHQEIRAVEKNPNNHKYVNVESDENVAATCCSTGKQVVKCSLCDHEETKITSIDPSNHAATAVHLSDDPENKVATCMEKGVEVWKCPACETKEYRSVDQDPENHQHFGEWETTKAATCKETGEETRTCACGNKTETRTTEIDENNHQHYGEWEITKAATCVSKGEKTHQCACGNHTETVEIDIDPTHHVDLTDWEITDADTCTETRSCTACHQVVDTRNVSFNVETHPYHREYKCDFNATTNQFNSVEVKIICSQNSQHTQNLETLTNVTGKAFLSTVADADNNQQVLITQYDLIYEDEEFNTSIYVVDGKMYQTMYCLYQSGLQMQSYSQRSDEQEQPMLYVFVDEDNAGKLKVFMPAGDGVGSDITEMGMVTYCQDGVYSINNGGQSLLVQLETVSNGTGEIVSLQPATKYEKFGTMASPDGMGGYIDFYYTSNENIVCISYNGFTSLCRYKNNKIDFALGGVCLTVTENEDGTKTIEWDKNNFYENFEYNGVTYHSKYQGTYDGKNVIVYCDTRKVQDDNIGLNMATFVIGDETIQAGYDTATYQQDGTVCYVLTYQSKNLVFTLKPTTDLIANATSDLAGEVVYTNTLDNYIQNKNSFTASNNKQYRMIDTKSLDGVKTYVYCDEISAFAAVESTELDTGLIQNTVTFADHEGYNIQFLKLTSYGDKIFEYETIYTSSADSILGQIYATKLGDKYNVFYARIYSGSTQKNWGYSSLYTTDAANNVFEYDGLLIQLDDTGVIKLFDLSTAENINLLHTYTLDGKEAKLYSYNTNAISYYLVIDDVAWRINNSYTEESTLIILTSRCYQIVGETLVAIDPNGTEVIEGVYRPAAESDFGFNFYIVLESYRVYYFDKDGQSTGVGYIAVIDEAKGVYQLSTSNYDGIVQLTENNTVQFFDLSNLEWPAQPGNVTENDTRYLICDVTWNGDLCKLYYYERGYYYLTHNGISKRVYYNKDYQTITFRENNSEYKIVAGEDGNYTLEPHQY